MKLNANHASLLVIMLSTLLLVSSIFVIAQDGSNTDNATCAVALEDFYVVASEACIGAPIGTICNGGIPPNAEPAGAVSNSLAPTGSLVEAGVVDSLSTSAFSVEGHNGGIVWLRTGDANISALLLGEVSVQDVTPPDFPAWTSLIVSTSEAPAACGVAPRSGFVVQGVDRQQVNMVVNGVSLRINGTVMVQTQGVETVFLTLDGNVQVIALGQTEGMVAGQQVRVPHEAEDFTRPTNVPTLPLPFEADRVANFPFALLDRPALMPQPGFAATQGNVNLRTAPTINAALLLEVPPGEIMTILGRNPAGDWYHVRLTSGYTGWMFADLLRREHGAIEAVYESTPVPPQRFGRIGTNAQVQSPDGVLMYSAPDLTFTPINTLNFAQDVTLLARSPYSPWVKVDSNGAVGWVPLIALDTQAIIASLIVDYDVPPPPEPTRVPGSFGNAFPDPSCFPDC
ncbi:MAG: SH3 domain-containing protein [Aggregatilineales bacterium]